MGPNAQPYGRSMSGREADVVLRDAPDGSPRAGDWLEVDATGEGSPRRGVILEVLGSGRHTHFRVRWDKEHVSLFYPAERGYLVHSKAPLNPVQA